MDLIPLAMPFFDVPDEDRDALRARLQAALEACAADSLHGRTTEVGYDEENEQFPVHEFITVTPDNLTAARTFGEVEVDEERRPLRADVGRPRPWLARGLSAASRRPAVLVGVQLRARDHGEHCRPWYRGPWPAFMRAVEREVAHGCSSRSRAPASR